MRTRGSSRARPSATTPSARPRPTSGAYASIATVPSGSCASVKRPRASATTTPSGFAPATSHVGTWSRATRRARDRVALAVDHLALDGPLDRELPIRGTANGRRPSLSGMAMARAIGAYPGARTRSFAGPGDSSRSANAPEASVRVRRTPRSVKSVTSAPATVSRPRAVTTSPVAVSAGASDTRSASPVPSVVTTLGARPGAVTSTRSAMPRARLRCASPLPSVKAVVRSGASAASELALTWAKSTGRSRSSTTVTGSGSRASGRRIVRVDLPPS